MVAEGVPRRTQAERRSESEEALLDDAAEAISERGIEQTSLALIGERAGKSRGLANHHFGSKSALVELLAERCHDRLEAATGAAVERAQRSTANATALEAVRVMVDTYLDHFEHAAPEERALIVMWGATFPTNSAVQGMLEADRRAYDGVGDLLARGQKEGSIAREVDPRAAAVILLGMMRGIAAQELTESAVIDIAQVRAACQHWITAALTPPPAGDTNGGRRRR